MTLSLKRPNGPTSEERLAQLETELGLCLPADYRAFLAETGGGWIGEDLPIPGTDGNGLLNELRGVDDLPKAQQRSGFNELVPAGYLIVGRGAGGALTIRLEGAKAGSVWWADYDQGELIGAEGPTEDVMRRLSGSWDMFLAQL